MNLELKTEWRYWENRRTHKINSINYLYIIILGFFSLFPLLQNNLLWTEYDIVNRSLFLELDSWKSIFSSSIFWEDNPVALISFCLESQIPLPIAFTHRFINILLHCIVAILLYRLLNRMHISGAFLTSLIFTVHPVIVQTVFWPGYRSNIISVCLILWCLYLALDKKNKKNNYLALILSGIAAALYPQAFIIPLILLLQYFVKNKNLELKNLKKIIPYIFIIAIFGIILKIFSSINANDTALLAGVNELKKTSFNLKLLEYLKIIYLPFGHAFFNPFGDNSPNTLIYGIPYIFFLVIFILSFFYRKSIWGRFLTMGVSLITASIIYPCLQDGYFLDGTYVIDDTLVYFTLIPAITIVSSSLNAFFVHKAYQLKILWYVIASLIVLVLSGSTLFRSFLYSKPIKTWEYFNITFSNSVTPKKAISDHLFSNGYNTYTIKDHIKFLEFVVKNSSRNNGSKVQLARLYIENRQDKSAQELYNQIVFKDKTNDEFILKEAANFFEQQGLYLDARETRKLLKEIIQ